MQYFFRNPSNLVKYVGVLEATFLVEELSTIPADIYLLKANDRSTRKRCEIYSKLSKTPERR